MRRTTTITVAAAAALAATGISFAGLTAASADDSGRGGRPITSESVIQQQDGTFLTVRSAAGTVSAVSSSSITVKSANGTSTTFAVDAGTQVRKDGATSTIAAIAVGDTVHVHGTVNGSTVTATRIGAGERGMRAGREGGRGGRHGGMHGGMQGGRHGDGLRSPSPTASPSA